MDEEEEPDVEDGPELPLPPPERHKTMGAAMRLLGKLTCGGCRP